LSLEISLAYSNSTGAHFVLCEMLLNVIAREPRDNVLNSLAEHVRLISEMNLEIG
jgi:hypothetical protein